MQKRIKEAEKQQGDKGLNPLLKQKLELAGRGRRAFKKIAFGKGRREVDGEGRKDQRG